eukprot:m.2294 g.2294  ORF g.2294 m.2294 type:complete len:61 (+) comp1694_c0_seq1:22-204(+)
MYCGHALFHVFVVDKTVYGAYQPDKIVEGEIAVSMRLEDVAMLHALYTTLYHVGCTHFAT